MCSIEPAKNPIELHIHSSKEDFSLVELLTAVGHFYLTGSKLGLGHSVNFGRPWQDQSLGSYGYISLPYLYGPDLEDFIFSDRFFKCYWLIPVTADELKYKKEEGVEALEEFLKRPDPSI